MKIVAFECKASVLSASIIARVKIRVRRNPIKDE